MQQGAGTGLSLPAVPSSLREASKGPLAEIGGQRTASSEQNVSITRHTSKLSQHIFVSLTEISFVFFFHICKCYKNKVTGYALICEWLFSLNVVAVIFFFPG